MPSRAIFAHLICCVLSLFRVIRTTHASSGRTARSLLSGLDTDEADSDRKLRKHVLKELRIPAGCKAAIVQQLERVNIHQASLFPEPDTVAQYLRRK